jgi:hypothetical protein
MAFFTGTIFKEDGSVCCAKVMVALEPEESEQQGTWYGTVSAAVGIDMVAGTKYRLVLSDGRAAQCMVRRNTSAGPQDRAISIQGLGPLK